MRSKYPNAYSYFYQFFNDLISRGGEPYKSKLKPYKNLPLEKAEKLAPPFYWVFNASPSLAPYKVVWKYIAGAITGKASFSCAVLSLINNKIAIPNEKLMLIPFENLYEAYYVSGILNSVIARAIISSYVVETEISTHITKVVKIPKYDPNNNLQKEIADLSRRAHELARCIYASSKPSYCAGINAEDELRKVEDEIDKAVAELYGISESELKGFRRLMAILSGKESPVEDEVKVPENPDVNVPGTLLRPGVESYIEVDVTNPSGEELEITYELPWGKGSFRITEGKHRINAPPLNPGKYKGVLRWTWRGVEYTKEFEVEVSEPMGPKRPRTLLNP